MTMTDLIFLRIITLEARLEAILRKLERRRRAAFQETRIVPCASV